MISPALRRRNWFIPDRRKRKPRSVLRVEIYRGAFTEFQCCKDGVAVFLDKSARPDRRLISENARDRSRRSRGGHHDQSFPSSSCTRRSFLLDALFLFGTRCLLLQFHFGGTSRSPRGQLEAIAHLEGKGKTYICFSSSLLPPLHPLFFFLPR